MFISLLSIIISGEGDIGPSAFSLNMGSIAIDDLPLHVLLLNPLSEFVGKCVQAFSLLVADTLQVKNV